MKKKVLILKNDRTGDLFVSVNAINKIMNKHYDQNILIYLSKINHKFSFLFSKIEINRLNDFIYYKELQISISNFIGDSLYLNLFSFFHNASVKKIYFEIIILLEKSNSRSHAFSLL